MKGKINKKGIICVLRGGKMQSQSCPFGEYDADYMPEVCNCGDWCPLFGEPFVPYISTDDAKFTRLQICQGRVLDFDEFTDERISKNE